MMQQVDEPRLETDLEYRFHYVADFIGFTEDDIRTIHELGPQLAPGLPGLVDAVYEKLLSNAATARHFLPRQHGYKGPLPGGLEVLSHDNQQIKFRKEHLRRYLESLVTNTYDSRMVRYLDMAGKIHTPKAGNENIDVPLVQMNALMGFVAAALTNALYGLNLEPEKERRAVQSFGKLLWIQNDLINRHYAAEASAESASEQRGNPAAVN